MGPVHGAIDLPYTMANAILNGMKIRVDKSGRVVFPKPLRQRLGVTAGADLEVVEQPGGILLRPVQQLPSMVLVDGFWVHQGAAESGATCHHGRPASDVAAESLVSMLSDRPHGVVQVG